MPNDRLVAVNESVLRHPTPIGLHLQDRPTEPGRSQAPRQGAEPASWRLDPPRLGTPQGQIPSREHPLCWVQTADLQFHLNNTIVVIMIPSLITLPGSPWSVLPPGIHEASLDDVATAFATNAWRRELFDGLVDASGRLRVAGCQTIYLDGSYVSGKPMPGDFDGCWDPSGINPSRLDPVFLEFANGREAQKTAFKGEFFPSSMMCADIGQTFLDFFQLDRFTGVHKGIISIRLSVDPLLLRKAQP